jgi:hypothetical protein
MLSVAKPILQQQLLSILEAGYMSQFNQNELADARKYDSNIKSRYNNNAKKFAQTASGPVADAIYNFVKEIGIMATITGTITAPPAPPVLPGGPCFGSIPLTGFVIS